MMRLIILILGVVVALPAADEVKIIKDPKPTCVEKEYRRLVKVKELKEDENSEDFLVKPCSLVVDDRGHIFVMDAAQAKIFQYDPDLNLVRTFGRRGRGPGEFGWSGHAYVQLFLRGNEIYLPDSHNNKVLCFSTKGELVKEIPFKYRGLRNKSVALDHIGNVYLHSDNNPGNPNCIDCLDPKGSFVRGYLERSVLKVGLYKEFTNIVLASRLPPGVKHKTLRGIPNTGLYDMVSESKIFFSVTPHDRLLAYSSISGRLWVFHQSGLESTRMLWPEKALRDYREEAVNATRGYRLFFVKMVLDSDDADRFLLHYGTFRGSKKNYLYQFELSGRLIRVFFIINPERSFVNVHAKRNGRFYATQRNEHGNLTISLYKEENHE